MNDYTYKNWTSDDYYDFYIEFNRIELYNEYCKNWLKNYYNIDINFNSKTDWTIYDVVDIKDFNRVKENINNILNTMQITDTTNLNINTQYNQTFTDEKANEIELRLKLYLKQLGEWQFTYNICGLTTCGNNNSIKLGGVL